MPHGYAVVNGYGVELGSIASQAFNLLLDDLASLMQMGVAGHKLGELVADGDDGLAKLLTFHAIGHPEGTGAGHAASLGADTAA